MIYFLPNLSLQARSGSDGSLLWGVDLLRQEALCPTHAYFDASSGTFAIAGVSPDGATARAVTLALLSGSVEAKASVSLPLGHPLSTARLYPASVGASLMLAAVSDDGTLLQVQGLDGGPSTSFRLAQVLPPGVCLIEGRDHSMSDLERSRLLTCY